MEKKFHRKLTPFLCKEMLYDFATDRLDHDRKMAVSEFIKNDQECQMILEAIRQGLSCADRLSNCELKPEILAQLHEAESAISLGRKYVSWREWPESLRWSIAAVSISAVVALAIALIPWSRLPLPETKKASDSVELAQIPTSDGRLVLDANDDSGDTTGDEGSGDELFDGVKPSEPPSKPQVAANLSKEPKASPRPENETSDGEETPIAEVAPSAAVASPAGASASNPPPTAAPSTQTAPSNQSAALVAAAQVPAAQSVPAATPGAAATPEATPASPSAREPKTKGFVYRAFMNLDNLEEIAPKITANIVELGGEKAGEVELGWKRGTGRYYHFALPETNEEKILEILRAYGPVRISKDPHPRVMPEGQVRFILWVETLN